MDAGRKLHRRHAIEYFLPVAKDVGAEIEIDLDVAQAENRERTDVGQAGHAGQRHLHRDGDLPFDFFGRPPRILGDQLDHGRRRVRIGDDVEQMERVEATEQQRQSQCAEQDALDEGYLDETGDHLYQ